MAIDAKNLKRPGKGMPPASVETNNNLAKPPSGVTVPLQLNIDPEIRRAFKAYAAERDVDPRDLFVTVWRYYKENHG
jgi:hypothetical protein